MPPRGGLLLLWYYKYRGVLLRWGTTGDSDLDVHAGDDVADDDDPLVPLGCWLQLSRVTGPYMLTYLRLIDK